MADTDNRVEQVLLDIMQSPTDPGEIDLAGLSDPDWAALIELAQQHRCAAFLAHHAAGSGEGVLPERLRLLRQRSVQRSMSIQRECLAIHDLFATAGISHLFLKGVPLALRDYPKPWTRPMRDIDVVVDPGRLEDAHRLLVAAGGKIEAYAGAPRLPRPKIASTSTRFILPTGFFRSNSITGSSCSQGRGDGVHPLFGSGSGRIRR